MIRYLFITISVLLIACSPKEEGESQESALEPATSPKLVEAWTSDTLLRTPEAVLYDPARKLLYVANVNDNPWEKDGNGFISRMDMNGKILDLKWVEDLNGPKGMGILAGKLYVADINAVVEIDIEKATITNRYELEGTPTLNDITVLDGRLFVSGSDSNKVFELKEGVLEVILDGELGRPNGLFAEEDRLLMITSNSSQLLSIDMKSMQSQVLVDSLGHGDGIVPVGNGDYLASSWRGEVFYISADWERMQLLDTRALEINAADIEFVIDQQLLLVPTFFDNRVVAYHLKN